MFSNLLDEYITELSLEIQISRFLLIAWTSRSLGKMSRRVMLAILWFMKYCYSLQPLQPLSLSFAKDTDKSNQQIQIGYKKRKKKKIPASVNIITVKGRRALTLWVPWDEPRFTVMNHLTTWCILRKMSLNERCQERLSERRFIFDWAPGVWASLRQL